MVRKSRWLTKEDWIQYGIEHKYGDKSPYDLFNSADRNERSWYSKGSKSKWIDDFSFSRKKNKNYKEISKLKDINEWIQYGLDHKYNTRTKSSLLTSEDKKEIAWYIKGYNNNWHDHFPFNKNLEYSHLENLLAEYTGGEN